MTRHPHDLRSSSPAVQRAREREEKKQPPLEGVSLDVKVEDLDEIGLDIHQTLPEKYISELLDDGKQPHWSGHGDSRIDVHLEREASFVRVKGKAHFLLSHPCVRCLNDVPFDVDLPLDLRLVERVKTADIEADYTEGNGDGDDFAGAPLGDAADLEDLDVASFEAGVVKLGDLMREQLFLELPMHPACDSPRARPLVPCAFDEKKAKAEAQGWVDPRWAQLAALRDKLAPAEPVPLPGRESRYEDKKSASEYEAKPAKPAATPKPAVTTTKPAATTTKPAVAKPAAKKAKPAKKPAAKKAKPAKKPAAKKAKPAKKAAKSKSKSKSKAKSKPMSSTKKATKKAAKKAKSGTKSVKRR